MVRCWEFDIGEGTYYELGRSRQIVFVVFFDDYIIWPGLEWEYADWGRGSGDENVEKSKCLGFAHGATATPNYIHFITDYTAIVFHILVSQQVRSRGTRPPTL